MYQVIVGYVIRYVLRFKVRCKSDISIRQWLEGQMSLKTDLTDAWNISIGTI